MTEARAVAKRLRAFMNKEQYTASDVQRGLVVILNGRMAGDKQKAPPPEPPDPLECKT